MEHIGSNVIVIDGVDTTTMETDTSAVHKTIWFNSPQYVMYEDRIKSYKNWPIQLINPTRHQLAEAGLFYSGQSDTVICFSCNVRITQWMATDQPWEEHRKWSPDCLYTKMCGMGECSGSMDTTGRDLFNSNVVPPPMDSVTTNTNQSRLLGNLSSGFTNQTTPGFNFGTKQNNSGFNFTSLSSPWQVNSSLNTKK